MNGAAGNANGDQELLWPREVAELCGVGPETVTRWARQGLLEYVRTPGGQRRYRAADVWALAAVRDLLTTAQVAAMFRVDPRTVWTWTKKGKLTAIRTHGRRVRYRQAEVQALYAATLGSHAKVRVSTRLDLSQVIPSRAAKPESTDDLKSRQASTQVKPLLSLPSGCTW